MQKKMIGVLSLLLGITGALYAQQRTDTSRENRLFELPYFSITHAWHISLGKGDYLELELAERSELSRFQNVDSLLLVYIGDMKPFRDSLADPLSGKRIDYLVDGMGHKMVRIHETKPSGTSFLLGDEQPSLLRLKQDTICILLQAPPPAFREIAPPVRYDRLTLVVNRWDQLESLVTAGLNTKMRELGIQKNWSYAGDFGGGGYLVSDPSVTIKKEGLYSSKHNRDVLELDEYANIQNYKNYFVPSVSLGATIGLRRGYNDNTFGLHWEPTFLFAPDAQGQLHTFRNDLLVISISHDRIDSATGSSVGLNTNLSFGWFVHREGGFFTGTSFRLTAFGVQLKKGFGIQPCIYFNDFFRSVTPGLRLSYKFL
jgi:hypothetical protein